MSTPLRRLAMAVTAALVGGTLGAAGLVVPAAVGHHIPSHVEVIVPVNALHDAVDTDPSDGVCSTGQTLPSGAPVCTLRAAVQHANASYVPGTPDVYVIDLNSGVHTLTLPGQDDASAVGDLDITGQVQIEGVSGQTEVRAAPGLGDRVLDVHGAARFHIRSVKVTGGVAPGGENGGGIRATGVGWVELGVGSEFSGNSAQDGGGVWIGTGRVQAWSTIRNNTASRDGGGMWIGHDTAVTTSVDGLIEGNTAGRDGGGVWVDRIVVSATANIWDNTAGGRGGGLWVRGNPQYYGTVMRNTSGGDGGGVWVMLDTLSTGWFPSFYRTVFDGNRAEGGDGGGLWVGTALDNRNFPLAFVNASIRNNHADNGGGIWAGPVDGSSTNVFSPTLSVEGLRLEGNHAHDRLGDGSTGFGGGAYLGRGYSLAHSLLGAVVTGNVADLDGGGLRLEAPVDVGWSSVTENAAGRDGGGLHLVGASASTVAVTTISSNEAVRHGGGVHSVNSALTITDATVTLNVAGDLPHGVLGAGSIRRSIVAGNGSATAGWTLDCGVLTGDNEVSADPVWQSLGHNLAGPGCVVAEQPTDIDVVDAPGGSPDTGLGPLQDNGAFAGWYREGNFRWSPEEEDEIRPLTHAPSSRDSMLVDAAGTACAESDQREVPRPVGGQCDIGAIEYVEQLADIYIEAGSADDAIPVGESFAFVVEVRNDGPDEFGSATFTLTLPSGMSHVENSAECSVSGRVATCDVADESPAVEFTVRAPIVEGEYEWTAGIVQSGTHDPRPDGGESAGSVLAFGEYTGPQPGFDDSDGDGVADSVDSDPEPPTPDPSGPGGFGHGETNGHILERAGHSVFVQPDPNQPEPENGRVLIDVTETAESTPAPAVTDVCGYTLRLQPPAGVIVVCGSLHTEVIEGAAEIELPDGTLVTVPEGVTALIAEDPDGSLRIVNENGAGTILIARADGTLNSLDQGELVLPAPNTDPDPEPDPPVDPCKNHGKKNDGKNEKSKSKSDKGKNKSECKDPKPTPSPKPTKTEKPKDPKPKPTKTEKPKDPKPKPTKTEKPKDPKPKPTKTEKPKADSKSNDSKSKDSKSKDSKSKDTKPKDKNGNSYGKNQSRPY